MNSETIYVDDVPYTLLTERKDRMFCLEISDCPPERFTTIDSDLEIGKRRIEGSVAEWIGRFGSRSLHQRMVDKFMRLVAHHRTASGFDATGQNVPERPWLGTMDGRRLRAKLILEEALEMIEALGFDVRGSSDRAPEIVDTIRAPSLVGIADGAFDLSVVSRGTLSYHGIPDHEGQMLVDMNNLEKFAPGFTIRNDGKLVKPPNHKKPDLEGWLRRLNGA